ncbi:SDR family NAD(P)-dependent oxidoreductase [bacterium]|nr:SDR family NAD(P)-dependent oxidoreductase [bacterium]
MAPNRTAMVTGASSGIGWGAVKVLAANGFQVFGSVRKAADADKLKQEFGDRFTPVLFDVTDEERVRAGAEEVRAALGGRRLGGLVNNAGIAVGGPLLHLPVADFRKQLEVNLTGVLIATQAFAPLLGADPSLEGPAGRIVNIGSVGGRQAFPFMGPYHTTKFGLEGFTESLRRELLIFGIDATLIAPGSVASEIWGKSDAEDWSAYDHTAFKRPLAMMRDQLRKTAGKGLPPERIGEAILRQLTAANPATHVTVTPEPFMGFLLKWLPKRMVDKAVGERMGLAGKTR